MEKSTFCILQQYQRGKLVLNQANQSITDAGDGISNT